MKDCSEVNKQLERLISDYESRVRISQWSVCQNWRGDTSVRKVSEKPYPGLVKVLSVKLDRRIFSKAVNSCAIIVTEALRTLTLLQLLIIALCALLQKLSAQHSCGINSRVGSADIEPT